LATEGAEVPFCDVAIEEPETLAADAAEGDEMFFSASFEDGSRADMQPAIKRAEAPTHEEARIHPTAVRQVSPYRILSERLILADAIMQNLRKNGEKYHPP